MTLLPTLKGHIQIIPWTSKKKYLHKLETHQNTVKRKSGL